MNEVIEQLKKENKYFPFEAIKKAQKMPTELTPMLLDNLRDMVDRPENHLDDIFDMYTLFLLAQYQEKQAFPLIMEFIQLSADTVDEILGDTITEYLPALIFSTYDGNLVLLQKLIADTNMDEFLRDSLLSLYVQLYLDENITKEDMIHFLRKLIENENKNQADYFVTKIAAAIADTALFEMIEDVQKLYDSGRIDLKVRGKYDEFIDDIYRPGSIEKRCYYIDDVTKVMANWTIFEKTEKQKEADEAQQQKQQTLLEKEMEREKRQKTSHKIDRNGSCPCGSGKKYKKCCMKDDEEARHGRPPYETSLDKEKAFADYPAVEKLNKSYDIKAIEIDRSVYLALHQRFSAFIGNKKELFHLIKGYNLLTAFEQFQNKLQNDPVQSFADYDKKYMIHYKSQDWINELLAFLNSDPDFLVDEKEQAETKEEVRKVIQDLDK